MSRIPGTGTVEMTRNVSPVAKISRPVLGAPFPRKRLFRLLDRALLRPVVWISGPAGCGKTTLVNGALSARGAPCLWYRLDAGDEDVASFFFHLALAARRLKPGSRNPLPVLTPEHSLGLPAFTHRYFGILFGGLPRGSVVVLDDYHAVPEQSRFHEMIRDGLSCLPDGVRAVVISRAAPPPVFARKRAHLEMGHIGWSELRLTPEETKGIARLRGGKQRRAVEIRALHSRSGGWAAGLVLMLEQASGEALPPRREKEGTPKEVFDYFAGEIFQGLGEQAKNFLLKSAFLPGMTPRMAETLTGHRRAGTILSFLNRYNYFTDLHLGAEKIYGYHPLFRDFLLSRAGEYFPAKYQKKLRSRAASVLEDAGFDEDAVNLFREAGDREGVLRVILRQAPRLVLQGRTGTLAEWIALLPEGARGKDPWLRYWSGVCRLPADPGESLQHFETAYRGFRQRKEREWTLLAWSGVVESVIYGAGSLKWLDPWLSDLVSMLGRRRDFPPHETECRITGTVIKALALRRSPSLDMDAWAERATRLAREAADKAIAFTILLNVAYYRFHSGDILETGILLDSLRAMSRNPEIAPLPRLSFRWLEAAHANMTGEHDRCLNRVTEGLELAEQLGVHAMDMLLLGHGALCSMHRGDLPAARRFLGRMASRLTTTRTWEASFYHYLSAWEALHGSDLAKAYLHSDSCLSMCEEVGNPWTDAMARLQRAFLLYRDGKAEKASRFLRQARRIGDERRMKFVRFACLLAGGYFSLKAGDEKAGLESVRDGLRAGRENGYVDVYLWYPGLLETVASVALENGIEADYARDLVRKNGIVPEGVGMENENWPWPLKVQTFGRFELLADGKPLKSSRKVQQKPLLLLRMLICLGGRGVPEERITDALWPDSEGDLAHYAFSMTLSRLRRLLGNDQAVFLREGRLTLDVRHCWVDSLAFESLLAQVDSMVGGGEESPDVARAMNLARRAVSLYRGPFLAEEARHPWVVKTRERLRSKFLRAVEFLGRCFERQSRWAEAAAWYRKGLEVDDLAEGLYQRLMACHIRLGQVADALNAYERCRKNLASGLGISPSPETETVVRPYL